MRSTSTTPPTPRPLTDTALEIAVGTGRVVLPVHNIITIIVSFVVITTLFILLKYTKWGLGVRATASNERVASMMGVNTKFITAMSWAIAAAIGSLAASLYAPMVQTLTVGFMVFMQVNGFLATDPVQVIPLLMAQKNKDFNTMSFIFDKTIYTVNKPTAEDNKLWIDESLKQVNLVDADWALTTQNMSDDMGFYGKGSGKIKDINAPTLHTWGDKDITVPRFMIDDNVNAIKNSTLKVYENCGHSPFVDNMDGITKDILDFIRQT